MEEAFSGVLDTAPAPATDSMPLLASEIVNLITRSFEWRLRYPLRRAKHTLVLSHALLTKEQIASINSHTLDSAVLNEEIIARMLKSDKKKYLLCIAFAAIITETSFEEVDLKARISAAKEEVLGIAKALKEEVFATALANITPLCFEVVKGCLAMDVSMPSADTHSADVSTATRSAEASVAATKSADVRSATDSAAVTDMDVSDFEQFFAFGIDTKREFRKRPIASTDTHSADVSTTTRSAETSAAAANPLSTDSSTTDFVAEMDETEFCEDLVRGMAAKRYAKH